MKYKPRRKPLSLSKRIKQMHKLMIKPIKKGIQTHGIIYLKPGKYTEDISIKNGIKLSGIQ